MVGFVVSELEELELFEKAGFAVKNFSKGLYQITKDESVYAYVNISGIGTVNAALGTAELLKYADTIINIGLAGSLKGHPIGTVLNIYKCYSYENDCRSLGLEIGQLPNEKNNYIDNPHFIAWGSGVKLGEKFFTNPNTAVLASGNQFCGRELREGLKKDFGDIIDAVDMEGYGVAKACERQGAHYQIIKIVSDDGGEDAYKQYKENKNFLYEIQTRIVKEIIEENGAEKDWCSSFDIDHNRLLPGFYVSRVDRDIITFDFRTRTPYKEPVMSNEEMHSFEHYMADRLRRKLPQKIVYVGAMACATGYYILVFDTEGEGKVAQLIIDELIALMHSIKAGQDVPANTQKECGNYHTLNKEIAQKYADEYERILRQGLKEYPA